VENNEVKFSIKIYDQVSTDNHPIIISNEDQYKELSEILELMQKESAKIGNNYLSVNTLSDFYTIIFAIISIVAVGAGLLSWQKSKDFEEKIEQKSREHEYKIEQLKDLENSLKKLENEVKKLTEMKRLANFVRELFKSDENKNVSFDELLKGNEQKDEEGRIIGLVSEQYIRSSWLEIIYTKNILKNENDLHRFKKAYQIYEYILNRDFIDEDKQLKALIYHLIGQLLFDYYKFMTEQESNNQCPDRNKNICSGQPIGCTPSWMSHCENKFNKIECLENSIHYYKKSLNIKMNSTMIADETLGNLAVVQIKLFLENKEAKQLLEAEENLKSIKHKTYTHYWDLALVYHYMSNRNLKIMDNLNKAVNAIKYHAQKEFFIDGLKDFNRQDEIDIITQIIERCDKLSGLQ